MDSRSLPRLGFWALLIFLGGAGAQAAWTAGYWGSMSVCGLIALWSAVHLLVNLRSADSLDGTADDRWLAAVLARERQARALAAYLDHAPVPLLAMGQERGLYALNLAARRAFVTDDLVADPPAALTQAIEAARPGQPQAVSLELEGARRAYALTVADLESDETFARIVALVDIQSQLQAAEAATLRELLQVLSHEIMNSLTPVTSLAQTAAELLRTEGDGEKAREAVESVARRSEGLLRFIAAYRELARLPEPRFETVSLRSLLDEVALLFRSRWSPQGVVLDCRPPADITASLDRDLISQALLNILANAAEAALEGAGEPRVALSAERTRQGRLVLRVADSGPGVNLPDPSIIFRPFFTTKPTGTGVGLSLARQVALAHGGEIAVEAGGPGATVVMTF
ncbi:MAG TPA: HAMP domain-containing sensor histidine kinase [Caulobacter sp.]|nr:HAMP domain-containing sensor histidine kinase [Caulobacter sp.]